MFAPPESLFFLILKEQHWKMMLAPNVPSVGINPWAVQGVAAKVKPVTWPVWPVNVENTEVTLPVDRRSPVLVLASACLESMVMLMEQIRNMRVVEVAR